MKNLLLFFLLASAASLSAFWAKSPSRSNANDPKASNYVAPPTETPMPVFTKTITSTPTSIPTSSATPSVVFTKTTTATFTKTISPTPSATPTSSPVVAYSFLSKWGTSGSGNGQFIAPIGIDVDSSGNIYVTDWNNSRIQKFTSAEIYSAQWSSPWPVGLAIRGTDLYTTDDSADWLIKFSVSGSLLDQRWSGGTNPGGVNLAPDGLSVYIAMRDANLIRKYTVSVPMTFISEFGTSGSGPGQFNRPFDLSVETNGDIFVADLGNHRIQKFDSNGNYLSQFGTYGSGNAQFISPSAVTSDSWGYLYVADTGNNRVQKLTQNGAFVTSFGTSGTGDGQFATPRDICVVGTSVYVTDFNNRRVQRFGP